MEAHLVEVIKSSVQIGEHARRRFVGDLDSVFQDALKETYQIKRFTSKIATRNSVERNILILFSFLNTPVCRMHFNPSCIHVWIWLLCYVMILDFGDRHSKFTLITS